MTEQEAGPALADAWDAEPVTVWEPITFRVGDRVRIRHSAECRVVPHPNSPRADEQAVGHPEHEDGRTGSIDRRAPQDFLARQGHRYVVAFDAPMMVGGWFCLTGHYAAIELLLIDGSN